MKKILQHDKLKHFFVGTLISFPLVLFLPWNWALIICALGFYAKELVYDKIFEKGNYEILDWVYSIIPTIILIIARYY